MVCADATCVVALLWCCCLCCCFSFVLFLIIGVAVEACTLQRNINGTKSPRCVRSDAFLFHDGGIWHMKHGNTSREREHDIHAYCKYIEDVYRYILQNGTTNHIRQTSNMRQKPSSGSNIQQQASHNMLEHASHSRRRVPITARYTYTLRE
jgi:hypothetical protein